jgi:tellurite resistance protein TerC
MVADGNIALWAGFILGVLVLLALDLGVFHRTPAVIGARQAALWSGFWIALAIVFGAGVWVAFGKEPAFEFAAGYLLEKGLSVDNLFVFLVIFKAFAVPRQLQHRVLFWGIVGAVLMRGAFIAAGVALIHRFEWVLYVFGAILIVTGIRLFFENEGPTHPEQSRYVRFLRRVIPCSDGYRGPRFVVREDGRRMATPLLLVLIVVEVTDVIFATDSIPAIFGITRDPFIIFSSNVLAILGLRALFFLLADMMDRFHYLHVGLACVLVLVGVKMLIEKWLQVPVAASLGVVGAALGLSVIASLLTSPPAREPAAAGDEPRRAPTAPPDDPEGDG